MTDALDKLARAVDELPASAQAAWTLAHCAQSIEYSLAGFPALRSGVFRATIGPLVKRRFLRAGKLSHDIAAGIPGAPVPPELGLDEARERMRAAIASFRAHAGPVAPHFAYGACTKDEYAALHLFHLEDHLRKR